MGGKEGDMKNTIDRFPAKQRADIEDYSAGPVKIFNRGFASQIGGTDRYILPGCKGGKVVTILENLIIFLFNILFLRSLSPLI